ncbi:MAG TPA: hypothetical protein VM677_08480 [Actinokineospora sp.]|nr:hypothetical protein [Actinokineospora sp.]
MSAPTYTYMVHDLMSNAPLGELPLTGVRYGKRLNVSSGAQGQFVVEPRQAARRMVANPYDLTMPARRCLYIYRDEVPQWGGIIWTRRYDSSNGTVQIGCGDWWSYFDHRKVLPVLAPPIAVNYEVAELEVAYPGSTDLNAIARGLVALAQTHTGGDLGVLGDGTLSSDPAARTYRGYELVDVGEALRQLAGVIDGPDMMFDVDKTLDANGRPVRRFRQGTPRLGQAGSAWVWEYGSNLSGYVWPSDGSRYASRVLATGEGTAYGTPIAVAEDTSRYALGYPLMERESGFSTVSDTAVLQSHADAEQAASRLPVVLPQIEVRGDMSPMVGEWGMGDDAQIQIEDDFFPAGVDTLMRIVGADITPPDGSNAERVVLTMSPLLDDVA